MTCARSPYVCFKCSLQSLSISVRKFGSSSPRHNIPRPATAPKPTLDLKHIRENAEIYSRNCLERNYQSHADYPFKIQELTNKARRLDHKLRVPRARIKQLEKLIARYAVSGDSEPNEELASLLREARQLKDELQAILDQKTDCEEETQYLALALPNLSSVETPTGNDSRLVKYINFDPKYPPSWAKDPNPKRSHVSIGTSLNLIDFTSSATSTGWGWYFLTNEGALLEHALVQYALSVAMRHGWKAVSPPSLVYSYIAEACGFQPRDQNGEQQVWSIEQSEKDKSKPQRSLAGTAEIPLAAMYAGRDIDGSSLPIKLVGSSRCYRAEAGARGVDTKGLYRVHEFTKVELFGWTDQDSTDPATAGTTSKDLFLELLDIQIEILTSLNLPCRVLEMPSTDLGASASRKWDIETLFPSRLRVDAGKIALNFEKMWGEVTSASICTDYQSRRLGTRVRGGHIKEARFPHTVNGTAMAVTRVLAAILENGWDEERNVVVVPDVLKSWMGGLSVIGRAAN